MTLQLDLNDEQLELLLATLGKEHAYLYLTNKDNNEIKKVICVIVDQLIKLKKEFIFKNVFQEIGSQ